MHNDVPREGEEEGLIPQPSNPRQQCLIPMDAHLNLGKFLYEETPAWKKYHGEGDVVLVGVEQEPHRVQDWSELPVVRHTDSEPQDALCKIETVISSVRQHEQERFPVHESWCELMEAMSSVAEGATGVILARAGRSHVPEEESSVSIMSADVFELLIVKKQVSLVVSLPFYIQLSAHLQSPQEDISTELFTKVLSCSASALSERLSLNQPAKRVREVAQQLFDGGFKAASGSLVLSTQQ
eukprot:Em0522g4a